MLARENRNSVFCKVITLFKKISVYHRETVFQEFRILSCNVKIEISRTQLTAFKNYCMGNNISRCKFKSVILIMHKPFSVFIEKICTLASYSFGNKETFSCMLVIKSCRMELNKTQIFNIRTHFISYCNTVTCCNC